MGEIFPHFSFQDAVKSFNHRSLGVIMRREKQTPSCFKKHLKQSVLKFFSGIALKRLGFSNGENRSKGFGDRFVFKGMPTHI